MSMSGDFFSLCFMELIFFFWRAAFSDWLITMNRKSPSKKLSVCVCVCVCVVCVCGLLFIWPARLPWGMLRTLLHYHTHITYTDTHTHLNTPSHTHTHPYTNTQPHTHTHTHTRKHITHIDVSWIPLCTISIVGCVLLQYTVCLGYVAHRELYILLF